MYRTTPLLRQLGRASASTAASGPRAAAATVGFSRSLHQTAARRDGHAISNPTLANIEKRWEGMPPQEQADLWMALRDRMKVDWKEMTLQEKKAAYWIAFGPHGPRSLPPPGEKTKIFAYTMIGIGVAAVIFFSIGAFARPPPHTMTKEWQEATNEYLKESNIEPITGVSSEGYQGPGMVQSKPGKKQ